jgi:nitroreductase
MDVFDCIKTRKSIRKYLDKDIPDETIRKLIDCARHAPSSHNCQSWEFVIIKDKKTKEKLSTVHKWSGFVKNAPIVIVVCYDKKKLKFAPSDMLNPAIAAENLLLAAQAIGLGACWVYVKSFDEPEIEQDVKKILNIPEDISVLCMVPIGYPDEKPEPKKLRSIEEMIHFEKW